MQYLTNETYIIINVININSILYINEADSKKHAASILTNLLYNLTKTSDFIPTRLKKLNKEQIYERLMYSHQSGCIHYPNENLDAFEAVKIGTPFMISFSKMQYFVPKNTI